MNDNGVLRSVLLLGRLTVTLLLGCTEIPGSSAVHTGAATSAGGSDGGASGPAQDFEYHGPCATTPPHALLTAYGAPGGALVAAPGDSAFVNDLATLIRLPSGERVKLEVMAAGSRQDLVSQSIVLGQGSGTSLQTCSVCVMGFRNCAADGACDAQGYQYFPVSGYAMVTRLASDDGEAFAGEIARVTLAPVQMHTSLALDPLERPADDCIYIEDFRFSVPVQEATNCPVDNCFKNKDCSYVDCKLAATIGDRHPN